MVSGPGKQGGAELLYFPGYNTVQILSDSNLFTVFRSGAFVIFQEPDGTGLKIPASTTVQNIVFNDKTLALMIAVNQIYLTETPIYADRRRSGHRQGNETGINRSQKGDKRESWNTHRQGN